MSLAVVRTASRIVAACLKSPRPVDAEVAKGLREAHGLDDEARGRVVALVGRVLRRRALYTAALARLPFEARREGLVLAALVDGEEDAPLAAADRRALADALAEVRAEGDATARALRASPVPDWLAPRLAHGQSDDDARALFTAMGEAPPLTLRANTLHGDRDALARELAAIGIATHPTRAAPDGLIVDERTAIHRTDAFRAGRFEIQDEGSQILALLTGAGPGMVVVDGCAGAGGKTLALAAMMQNTGSLYAFDVHERRLGDLKTRAKRAGVHNLRVHPLDARGIAARKRLTGRADVVLVDAPCTGTGTLRRAPDIGWKLVPDDIPRLCATQRELLDVYAPLCKVGGTLVYATCSLLVDEDEDVVASFLAAHPHFAPAPLGPRLDALHLSSSGSGAVRLAPHPHGTDGFFAMVMRRER